MVVLKANLEHRCWEAQWFKIQLEDTCVKDMDLEGDSGGDIFVTEKTSLVATHGGTSL